MDPNAAYDEIRELITEIEHVEEQFGSAETMDVRRGLVQQAQAAVTLAEKFQALDEWLQSGGLLPKAWDQ